MSYLINPIYFYTCTLSSLMVTSLMAKTAGLLPVFYLSAIISVFNLHVDPLGLNLNYLVY